MSQARSKMTDGTKAWHIANWTALGWLETVIKLVAHAVGIIAFITALSGGGFGLPEGARVVQLVIMVVLSLGLVAAIYDRFLEREVIAMGFVVINNLGHWGMVAAMMSTSSAGDTLPLFCVLMLAGDLVKVLFLATTNFTRRDLSKKVLYGLTSVYVAGYVVVLFLELLR